MAKAVSELNASHIEELAKSFGEALRETPLIRSQSLEKRVQSKQALFLKAENLQFTGSFKARGALAKILEILKEAKEKGVITASAGNHAQGLAFHASRLGVSAKIVMPIGTPIVKMRATKQWGPEIILFGESYQEAYEEATRLAKESGRAYVHAFDDWTVMAGQGTIGVEILRQCPDVSSVFLPVGGGGLLAGVGSYLKAKNPKIKLIAVQAEGCSSLIPSLKKGSPVSLDKVNTIAEGMAVKRMGEKSFSICQSLVDETVIVSDEEISDALLWILENERLFVEGCGGATVAAAMKRSDLISGSSVILLSGGNLDVDLLARIIERGLAKQGRRTQFEVVIPDSPGSLEALLHVIAQEQASILQVHHERVFTKTALREVVTHIEIETSGLEHLQRVKASLEKTSWPVRFLP
ncbi:MAG: threonine ammonia-lyase [Bradymonadales bacterium]|nr:MAG: threonine ammonia-lyase [Bradymonadales bacterium]